MLAAPVKRSSTSQNTVMTKFKLRRIPLPRTQVNKERREFITLSSACASLRADIMSAIGIVRVMLVEDHAAFRQSLTALLSQEPDLEVVAPRQAL
jgi:hypothetical protein